MRMFLMFFFFFSGQKCYKGGGRKYHEKISWDRALARCRGYGGDLASIESQEEQGNDLHMLTTNK